MDNQRGIILMVASMLLFAIEDAFVKTAGQSVTAGLMLFTLSLGGASIFWAFARVQGQKILTPALRHPAVALRSLGEIVGTLGMVMSLILVPISLVSAIIQATPLVVTLGAALFLGAEVGWRRWLAIGAGLVGVLIILRPWSDAFSPATLLSVMAVLGLAVRDLATRACPPTVSSLQLSCLGFASLAPVGLPMLLVTGTGDVTPGIAVLLAAALTFGVAGYYLIVAAMRVGDIPVVTPFRYARLLFALVIGTLIFHERPDGWMLVGAAVVIGSGLYTLMRERALARRAGRR